MSQAQDPRWQPQLDAGLQRMAIALDEDARGRLLHYLALLRKWNQAFNLTAVRDPQHLVRRHLLDSLSILPWLRGPRLLDIGTGAGLPGIPLAVARPQWRFTLLDSNGKKIRFVRQAVLELRLENVEVCQARLETWRDPVGFDSILSRAFASLRDLVRQSTSLCAADGCWLAMKSSAIDQELAQLRAAEPELRVEQHELSVPGEPAGRRLVLISRGGVERSDSGRQT